jgi:3',5'-cyclic AMP phosphodiesterase CpdA
MNHKRYLFKIGPILFILLVFVGITCKQASTDFSFAFLADIHLQPELNALEGYNKAIRAVNELKPDFVITGGDQIMDALGVTYERAEMLYDLYIETTKELNMPVYNTLGNHDIFGLSVESGVDPDHPEYYKKMFQNKVGKTYHSFDHGGWHFMIIDSVDKTVDRTYLGRVDEEQMAWIVDDLKNIGKETPIVLATHLPFISIIKQIRSGSTEANSEGWVIVNSKEVLELFEGYNLKLVLQGHLHSLEEINVGGIKFLTGGAVSSNWWEGQYYGLEEGFVLIKIKKDELEWEYIDFGWEVQKGGRS